MWFSLSLWKGVEKMECKIIGTVVNLNKQLTKIMVNNCGKIEALNVIDLIHKGFNNGQLSIGNNNVEELGGFKLNEVAMAVEKNNGDIVMIKNGIAVSKRYYDEDNNYLGVEIRYEAGGSDNVTLDKLYNLKLYFKPYNFIIKRSETGKLFITGKDGVNKLDDIEKVIIKKKQVETKEVKPVQVLKEKPVTKIVNKESKVKTSNIDIIELFDIVESVGGRILKLPSETYQVESGNYQNYDEAFKPYYGIEIATSKIIFPESKINVSMNFKRPGYVMVDGIGKIDTFTYSSKKIFNNGENTMSKIGLLIPKSGEEKIKALESKGLDLRSVHVNEDIKGIFSGIIKSDKYLVLEVDTKDICLMSEKRQKKSIMSTADICNLCCSYYELKILSKYVGTRGYLMKTLKEEAGNNWFTDICKRDIAYNLRGYNDEQLNKIKEAGIDLFSGAYTKIIKSKDESKVSKNSSNVNEDVSIEYSFCGLDAGAVTGREVYENALMNNTSFLNPEMIKLVLIIKSKETVKEKYDLAMKFNETTEENMNKVNRKFWLHRAAMFIAGDKQRIHTHDKEMWELDKKNRSRKYDVYINKEREDVDLKVKVTGIAI